MKNAISILFAIFFVTNVNSQDCTNCNNEALPSGVFSSKVGFDNSAIGDYSFSGGNNSEANGRKSFAFGSYAITGNNATGAVVFGMNVEAFAPSSFVFGVSRPDQHLYNANQESMMIGFNSSNPTLFISRSPSPPPGNPNYNLTGKIGIGNVTIPQAKLHIRSDDGEIAALLIEPNNWSAGEYAKLFLGDTSHFIKVENTNGFEFNSQNNFIFSGNNTGFGITEPKAKVHINGDLLFEQSMNGIIMKSEDGNCWKGTISNNGDLQFTQIDCGTLTSIQNNKEQKHSEVFIYPNPTKGEITIEYTGNRKNLRVEFQTINGFLVATHKIKNGKNKIELKNIPGQMVIASVYTKKGELISTNKVVIKR